MGVARGHGPARRGVPRVDPDRPTSSRRRGRTSSRRSTRWAWSAASRGPTRSSTSKPTTPPSACTARRSPASSRTRRPPPTSCPHYPFGCKRVIIDEGYFETYNRDNVRLVNLRKNPIVEITAGGHPVAGRVPRARRHRLRHRLRRHDGLAVTHRHPRPRRRDARATCGRSRRGRTSASTSPASPTCSPSPVPAARRCSRTWSRRSSTTSSGSPTASATCVPAATAASRRSPTRRRSGPSTCTRFAGPVQTHPSCHVVVPRRQRARQDPLLHALRRRPQTYMAALRRDRRRGLHGLRFRVVASTPHLPGRVALGVPEQVRAEQDHVDRAYARIDELREAAVVRATDALKLTDSTPSSIADREAVLSAHGVRRSRFVVGDQSICFGRLDTHDDEVFHIGRLGVADDEGDPLLVDWRAPIAEAFYRATPSDPRGIRGVVTSGCTPARVVGRRRRTARPRGARRERHRTRRRSRVARRARRARQRADGRHRRHDPGPAGRSDPRAVARRARRAGRAGHGQDRGRAAPRRVPAVRARTRTVGARRAGRRAEQDLRPLRRERAARLGRDRRASRDASRADRRLRGDRGRHPDGRARQGRGQMVDDLRATLWGRVRPIDAPCSSASTGGGSRSTPADTPPHHRRCDRAPTCPMPKDAPPRSAAC